MEIDDILTRLETLSAEDKERLQTALGPAVKTEPEQKIEVDKSEQALLRAAACDAPGALTSPPRLSQFSGGENKNDVGYKQWIYEVRGLLKGGLYREALVLEAIRRSVRGTATDVLLNMGEQTSPEEVLIKMDRVFGNILPPERLLEQFYSAQQKERERAAVWACRLEDILSQLRAADMLRTKFFSGLHSGLTKNSLRHRFDANASYKDLLVAARVAELEFEKEQKEVKVQQATAVDPGVSTKLDTVLKQLDSMQKRLDEMEKKQKQNSQSKQKRPFPGKCHNCGEQGHRQFECPLNSKQPASGGSGQAATSQAPAQTSTG